ncbi:MAG TPA: MBL fold metallo-hydrolase [Candidatus Dormibacteraeota bacterium]|jgi:glyoxylase-like metal-dependent hydrolase (beta-lactamase superfamily II)
MASVRRVVAPNPSPFTGPGTNTWILGDGPALVVIDPGPDDESHLAALQRTVAAHAVGVVLVTHAHADHLELAERFAGLHHARVARFPDLGDGDVVRVGPLSLTAVHTPGHAPDHLAFWMADDRVLFTGDLILGRGSSMVTYPEGDVAAYLRSLERVAELRPRMLFPGHWDPVMEAETKIAEYREHRLARERQVVDELEAGGPGTARELTERVYAAELATSEGREHLLRAAEMTLRAHLRKLVEEGRATEADDRFALA